MIFPLLLVMVSFLSLAWRAQAAGIDSAVPAEKIDALFAEWDTPDSPGGSLAVIRDGQILYRRGYGRANLEYGVPNTPQTPFHVASVSKQFTAFAIHLLASEKKLSLDDDVRKHLPELHDFGKTITLRHLLHHTSGLRDQWDLLMMAGWRIEDVITQEDILRLVWRQRGLNFEPGTAYLYSNTGYSLLGEIVRRVSGQTLREFTEARIFKPLGMASTHFHNDHTEVVEGRAYSYHSNGGSGFRHAVLSFSNEGATSLFTTVEDMAKWDRNLYDGRVGGMEVVRAMHEKGRLNSGKEISYASGLDISRYKGLGTVVHTGMDAGFRSVYLRFPRQRFSVVFLANLGSIDAARLAFSVADLFLEGEFQPDPEAKNPPPEIRRAEVDPKTFDAYAGEYWFRAGFVREVLREGDQLYVRAPGSPKVELVPQSKTIFVARDAVRARYTFSRPRRGKSPRVRREAGEEILTGNRVESVAFTPGQLRAYEGRYYSEELGVLYTVTARDGTLHLRGQKREAALIPKTRLRFDSDLGGVDFKRARRSVEGFTLSTFRARNVEFRKVEIK